MNISQLTRFAVVIGFLTLYGCDQRSEQMDTPPTSGNVEAIATPTSTPPPPPVPSPTPIPTPTPPETPPPTPAARLAPEGVFYVVEAFSVTTNDGIHGFPKGKRVDLVGATGETMTVTDGTHVVEKPAAFFTNDLDLTDAILANNTAAAQTRHQANLQTQQRLQDEQNRARGQAFADKASRTSSNKDAQRIQIQSAIIDLDTRITAAEREIEAKRDRQIDTRATITYGGAVVVTESKNRRVVTFSKDASNIEALRTRRASLQKQLLQFGN